MDFQDRVFRAVFFGASVLSAGVTVAVLGFMILLSLPVLKMGFLWEVLTSPWSPGRGQFGILPMMAGTLALAFLSLVVSLPISLGCAFFMEILHPRGAGALLKKLVHFMTAVPTVIYGFVGVFLLVPLVREFFAYGSGMCILSASLMLGLVISPTLILFFSESFARVPQHYLNAVDALGGTVFQKLRHVILPQAWPGMLTGMVLAFGRAMGDTLIALMISGNAVLMPSSLLDSARTLTAHIALIFAADFDSIEFKILFISGIVLYGMTSLGILFARYFHKRALS